MGFLYGTFEDNNSVKVECIYEPPQDTSESGFSLLDDPKAVSMVLSLVFEVNTT